MSLLLQRRSSLAVVTVVIFLAGAAAGLWRYGHARDAALAGLQLEVRRSAVALDDATLARLPAASGAAPAPAAIQDQLARLAAVDPALRYVRVFRRDPASDGIVFLAGVSRDDAASAPAAASVYPFALDAPALRAAAAGPAAADGPQPGPLGPWVAGYALVGSPAEGAPAHVLGLGFAADRWQRTLVGAALGTAAYVWMFLILPLVALVTTRRQAQQRDALRNLTEAMEQGHSAVVIIDLGERIEYANTGFCRQLGYARRELIGRAWRELQGDATGPAPDVVAAVNRRYGWTGEWTMRRKDGSVLPVHGGITPVKDRSGAVRSFVAVFEDLSEVRRTENLLREAKERAEAGDRAKGQFLATMSHEVRTPLNGIVGFASLLLDTPLSPEQQEYVETIRTSSETLIQLTGDILDYARIESGRLKLEPQPCNPRECVENALDLVAAAAVQKNIELLHWIEDGVPTAIVADVGRLRQVIVNFVNNAVKFTHEGEVEVRVRTLTAPAGDPPPAGHCVLEFSVRDTGIGIASEHHAKIFRPFSQVDDSTTRRYGGTGLGLAICKNIVELMGGAVAFASQPGRGSLFTFTIRVPVHPTDPAPAAPLPLAGQRLAIAAKNAGLRDELDRLGLRLGAASIIHAESDTLAAQAAAWDLAIVDVPGAVAMELATRQVRPALPPDKVIALAPIVLPGELRAALRLHFRLVLNKPLHHDMLGSLLTPVSPRAAPAAPPASVRSPATDRFALRVLIVEDNAVNQRLIQKIISNLGCTWTSAATGRAALDELRQSVPDVVLMDLHMPELDGLTATAKIRAGEAGAEARDVWIVALTADAREEQRERTLAAGANDYLTKPVQLPELTGALQRFLRFRHR